MVMLLRFCNCCIFGPKDYHFLYAVCQEYIGYFTIQLTLDLRDDLIRQQDCNCLVLLVLLLCSTYVHVWSVLDAFLNFTGHNSAFIAIKHLQRTRQVTRLYLTLKDYPGFMSFSINCWVLTFWMRCFNVSCLSMTIGHTHTGCKRCRPANLLITFIG